MAFPIPPARRASVTLGLLTGLLVAGIALGAYRNLQAQRRMERAKAAAQLATVGELKASQIALWRRERLMDAGIFAHLPAFTGLARGGMAGPVPAESRSVLQAWMGTQSQYDQARLLDAQGRERLVLPAAAAPLEADLRRAALDALALGRPVLRDFSRDSQGIHLHLLVPILDGRQPGRAMGLFLLRIDPASSFYPFIAWWPTPSTTAETLLVRRDGDSALFLNPLRFQADTALALRLPLTDTRHPGVLAVLGRRGLVAGEDYRHVPVLADVRPIPDSPWFLETRMDLAEAMAGYRRTLRDTLFLALASSLVVLAVAAALWRHQRVNHYRHRLAAESELRRSEERFALAFNATPDAIAITKLTDGIYLMVNEGFTRLLGREAWEVLGRSAMALGVWVDPADRGRWAAALARDGQVDNLEVAFRGADGTAIPCLVSSRTITWDGELVQLSVTRDITGYRQMERSLVASQEEYRLLFDHSLDGVLFTAPDGRVLDANPAACRMVGLSREEIRARGRDAFLDPGDERLPAALADRARTGQWSGELTLVRGDGTRFPAEISTVQFHDSQGQPRNSIIVRDLTERKQAEELQRQLNDELQQTQKLDSLGSLAGGLAHDMNNILGAILSVTQTLKWTRAGDGELAGSLELMEKAATRGRDLVLGLTKFSRKNLHEPEVLDLNALVRDELALLSRTTLHKFKLVQDLEAGLGPIRGERGSLANALMNLCVNAMDAMAEGGTLTLRTRSAAGGQVALQVQDTGTGMAPEVAARAMDPFFSTKPIGKGTGLGLAMTYATAKAHGGTLAIVSEPGRGTTVTLNLPVAAGLPAGAGPAPAAQPQAGPSRILLVDDDDLIRATVPRLLEALGHQVTTAAGGAEALALLGGGLAVDLLILDLNMPGMNGLETHGQVRALRPYLPILLATGHLDPRASALLATDPRLQAIGKPFSLEDLDRKLQELKG